MVYSARGDQEYCYFYLLGGETTAKSSKASFQSKFFWYSSKLPSGLLATSHRKQSSSRGNHLSARRARAFISLASIPLAFTYFSFRFFLFYPFYTKIKQTFQIKIGLHKKVSSENAGCWCFWRTMTHSKFAFKTIITVECFAR